MRCEAEIVMGKVEDATTVPIQAVFNEGALRYVHIPEGGRYARRPVKVGRLSERFAEIAAGLIPGEKVLLREPKAGEIISRPWSDGELAAVGMKKGEGGQLIAAEPVPGAAGVGGAGPTAKVDPGAAGQPVVKTVAMAAPATATPAPVPTTTVATDSKPAEPSRTTEKKSDG
jgi:hypothetical protein